MFSGKEVNRAGQKGLKKWGKLQGHCEGGDAESNSFTPWADGNVLRKKRKGLRKKETTTTTEEKKEYMLIKEEENRFTWVDSFKCIGASQPGKESLNVRIRQGQDTPKERVTLSIQERLG